MDQFGILCNSLSDEYLKKSAPMQTYESQWKCKRLFRPKVRGNPWYA